MPFIELWGGPRDGDRFERPAPLPSEWHVPLPDSKTVRYSDPVEPTAALAYNVLRYRNTGCKTKDGKAIIFRYEKPKGKNG